jgi:alkanesulfonate monooxygenase SsuD/methylene tetrahydromethanopterin reductase-like flavin-dependent oxidoreductase (luciferase family)
MTSGKRPFKLGFFSYLAGPGSGRDVYPNYLSLAQLSEELGLDKAWVAQHHFGHHGGLPSPFVVFGALAAQTKHLGFGTAIVSLPYEHPIRLVEDAAVFETLFPGRLDLGLGTGFGSEAVMETFDIGGQVRREIYDKSVVRLVDALACKPVNDAGDTLFPDPGTLRQRLWESPSRVEGVVDAAKRGSGLLLSRVAIGVTGIPTDVVQRELVDAYYANLPEGIPPRIALSRTVYPSLDPDAAYRDIATQLESSRGAGPTPDLPIDELFEHFSIHWGTPAQVVESLRAEPLLDETTDLIFQVQPGNPDFETTKQIIRLMATEVAPALGWSPAH